MKSVKSYRKRSSAEAGRFGRIRRRREEFAGKLVQGVVMTILAASLLVLEFAAIRLIRAHFLREYGGQAWLLPIGIGLILLFIAYRLVKLWLEIRERLAEMREAGESSSETED